MGGLSCCGDYRVSDFDHNHFPETFYGIDVCYSTIIRIDFFVPNVYNYYTVSGVLQSVNDYRSHQVVVFDDAKAFYTESGIDLSKSSGKQITLTCRGRVGDRVNDTDLCKIDSVK